MVLGQTARYCTFDRYFDQERAQETYKNASIFLEGIGNYTYYSAQEASAQDYARIAAQQYLFLKAPGALLDATSTLLQHTKNIPLIISESELIGAFKNNLAKGIEPYTELAFEAGEKIKTGITKAAETYKFEIEAGQLIARNFVVKTAQEVKDIAQTLKTQWKTINEKLPTLTNASLKTLLKNEAFVDTVAAETTQILQETYKEYWTHIKSQYPEMIKMFKTDKVKLLLKKYCPNGLSDEEIRAFLDHIFNIVAKRDRDKTLLKMYGGHVNFKGLLQSSEILEFGPITKMIDGFTKRELYLKIPFGRFISYKTYFPDHWTPIEIIEYILDKLKDIQKVETLGKKTKFIVPIADGLDLEYKFNSTLDTVYGVFKK